ncbi:hypothetical protein CAXC1_80040 [Candidatus Xenohaliotis californiensis]|uniref:HU family DNA-binding protein n=1 Tax=Candidatus Xenohaliotis californiensis TaxID=84677 RepID=A0ABM9N9I5_9RICK|nr:hypothetical protein CAXC1_80040 [Candidatus Xenohaliotis californiensis]
MSGSRKKLAKALSKTTGVPMNMAIKFINVTLQEIINETMHSGKLNIKNFGTFKYKTAPEKKVVNLSTMEKIKMQARKTIAFKPSKTLHRYINNGQN